MTCQRMSLCSNQDRNMATLVDESSEYTGGNLVNKIAGELKYLQQSDQIHVPESRFALG